MQLVLYSGGDPDQNKLLNEQLCGILRPNPSVTLVPAASSDAEICHEEFRDFLNPHGITNIRTFLCDQPATSYDMNLALDVDLVFLCGGNTFHFLAAMQSSGFIQKLAQYARTRGTIAGLSAGAIITTPSIHTAGYPAFDRDDNLIGLTDLNSMNLAQFEFFPHYVHEERYINAFEHYTRHRSLPLLCSPDGSGVLVKDDQVTLAGPSYIYARGQFFAWERQDLSPSKTSSELAAFAK